MIRYKSLGGSLSATQLIFTDTKDTKILGNLGQFFSNYIVHLSVLERIWDQNISNIEDFKNWHTSIQRD